MLEYAINDHALPHPSGRKLGAELQQIGRLEWFKQSCQRALEQSLIDRVRDAEEAWRIAGAEDCEVRAAAVLRALWQWRETEAQAADRPPFHILQNQELLRSAESFAAGGGRGLPALLSSASPGVLLMRPERALQSPETEWPRNASSFWNNAPRLK